MNVRKYLKRNKKRSLLTILGITLSSILLISIGILFSSFRDYLIYNVESEIGDYHVVVEGVVDNESFVKKLKFEDGKYFVTYKNIYNVYKNTEKLCGKDKCQRVEYNTNLLSLYGISKNKNELAIIKKIMYFLIVSLGVILFFIIYNSFKVSLNSRRRDFCSLKLIGYTNFDICKLFMLEGFSLGLIGIICGFVMSLLLNYILVSILNERLFEIFGGNLKLSIYLPFIIVPILSIFLIVFLSSFLPLKSVSKFKVMELFRVNEKSDDVRVYPFKNFVIYISLINYMRQSRKYKSLIKCIFISCLSVSVFFLFLKYGLRCLDEFVIVPKYDVKMVIKDDYEVDEIIKKIRSKKYITFKSCSLVGSVNKDNYLKGYKKDEDILVTNLGGNEVINRVNKIERDGRIIHLNYKKFKKMDGITTSDFEIGDLKLTDKVPFGFDEIDKVTLNLDEERFNDVCTDYEVNLISKTDFQGIDDYILDLVKTKDVDISYINVRKVRKIIGSLISVFKLFLYGICILIVFVMATLSINISYLSTFYRKMEFARLRSIGLEFYKVLLSLVLESLIVSFKGWFYALPFVFILNKYFYVSVNKVFTFGKMITCLDILILTLIISFIITGLSMVISYILNKSDLVSDIKNT